MEDQLAKIEKMLEQGMNEEQILAALGVRTAPKPLPGTSIGPVQRDNSLLSKIMEFAGVRDGRFMDIEEEQSTLPIPFTQKRLAPADAAMTALGGMETAAALKAIPQIAWKLGFPKRPPLTPHGPMPAPKTEGVDLGRLLGEQMEPNYPGLLTREEGGHAAMQMLPRFGQQMAKRPPQPRLVRPTPEPTFEDVITKILKEMRVEYPSKF